MKETRKPHTSLISWNSGQIYRHSIVFVLTCLSSQHPTIQGRSPRQRRQSHGRRGLAYQRAHVDVSPEPCSQSASSRHKEGEGSNKTLLQNQESGGEDVAKQEDTLGGADGEVHSEKSG